MGGLWIFRRMKRYLSYHSAPSHTHSLYDSSSGGHFTVSVFKKKIITLLSQSHSITFLYPVNHMIPQILLNQEVTLCLLIWVRAQRYIFDVPFLLSLRPYHGFTACQCVILVVQNQQPWGHLRFHQSFRVILSFKEILLALVFLIQRMFSVSLCFGFSICLSLNVFSVLLWVWPANSWFFLKNKTIYFHNLMWHILNPIHFCFLQSPLHS